MAGDLAPTPIPDGVAGARVGPRRRQWFSAPFQGISMSLACHVAGIALSRV